ncbi:MAG TPA: sugar phosphate isomerase/epimerase [Armatimonadota bacterium]|jgi:sugar phosphate isomerase/epimerase
MLIANSMNLCFSRFDERELLPRMAAAGYDGVDFNFWDLVRRVNWHDDAEADRWLDALAQSTADAGLTWVQGHGPVFDIFQNAAEDIFQRDLCAPALRACARLGVPWLVLHPCTAAGAFDRAHLNMLLETNRDFVRTLLPLCERYGVGLALENIFDRPWAAPEGAPRFFGAIPDELAALIDAIAHPLVGACWDTGHANVMHLDQRAALTAMGTRVKVLHLHDNNGQHDEHHLPFIPRPHGVDWDGVMAGLRAGGYTGALTFEVRAAFEAVPLSLFDDALRYSVQLGRQLAQTFETAAV